MYHQCKICSNSFCKFYQTINSLKKSRCNRKQCEDFYQPGFYDDENCLLCRKQDLCNGACKRRQNMREYCSLPKKRCCRDQVISKLQNKMLMQSRLNAKRRKSHKQVNKSTKTDAQVGNSQLPMNSYIAQRIMPMPIQNMQNNLPPAQYRVPLKLINRQNQYISQINPRLSYLNNFYQQPIIINQEQHTTPIPNKLYQTQVYSPNQLYSINARQPLMAKQNHIHHNQYMHTPSYMNSSDKYNKLVSSNSCMIIKPQIRYTTYADGSQSRNKNIDYPTVYSNYNSYNRNIQSSLRIQPKTAQFLPEYQSIANNEIGVGQNYLNIPLKKSNNRASSKILTTFK